MAKLRQAHSLRMFALRNSFGEVRLPQFVRKSLSEFVCLTSLVELRSWQSRMQSTKDSMRMRVCVRVKQRLRMGVRVCVRVRHAHARVHVRACACACACA